MNDPLAARKYPNYTIHHWSNFVAKLNSPAIRALSQHRRLYATQSSFVNDRLLLAGLPPEIVFHRVLDLINTSVKMQDSNAAISSTVIAVPKFWPQQERDALRTVARAKKLAPYIVDSTTAIATSFAIEQQKYFLKGPTRTAFFDFGASNVQIILCEFSKPAGNSVLITEVAYQWHDAIGGRDLDIVVFDLLTSKYGHSLSPRGEQVVLLEANKIKHRLTTDKKVSGVIEIPDGQNLVYEVTRVDFEKAILPYLNAIRVMINRITENGTIGVDRVQLLGGSSRIPCVQKLLQECFGIQKLSTNMNPEEATALAAAWVGATKSSDYSLTKIDYLPLELYSPAVRTETGIFPYNPNRLPVSGGSVWLYNNVTGQYPIGASIYVVWSEVGPNTIMRTTKDGLLRFQNTTTKPMRPWKTQLLDLAGEVESQERARSKLAETANQLEKLLLDTKQTLEEESRLLEMSTPSERAALANAVSVTDRWFLNQQSFVQESLEKRLTLLEDAVGSVMCRVQNQELLPSAVANMSHTFTAVDTSVRGWVARKKKDGPKRRDIRDLLRMVADLRIWYEERRLKQERLAVTDNPALLWSELMRRVDAIDRKREEMDDAVFGRRKQTGKYKNDDVYVYPPESVNVKIDYPPRSKSPTPRPPAVPASPPGAPASRSLPSSRATPSPRGTPLSPARPLFLPLPSTRSRGTPGRSLPRRPAAAAAPP
jgi:molecular chaperone DnaK (HSP70)